jgi:hypothetical protein
LQDGASAVAGIKSAEAQRNIKILSSLPTGAESSEQSPSSSAKQVAAASSPLSDAIANASAQADAENAMTGAMAEVAAENSAREQQDASNASLLGYDSLWAKTAGLQGTPLDWKRQDVVGELEQSRYFVILMAYDFQLAWKQKKHKLLWETRFSISERHNPFDEALEGMARYASQYFGEDTRGLVKAAIPLGRVDIGNPTSIGTVEAPPK